MFNFIAIVFGAVLGAVSIAVVLSVVLAGIIFGGLLGSVIGFTSGVVSAIVISSVLIYFVAFMVIVELRTRGDRYFSRPLEERRKMREMIARNAAYIRPVFDFIAKYYRFKSIPVFLYQGVSGPFGMSSKKSYAATVAYEPQANDVFVATQMKCGTTWMQQVVFEILFKGEGDLSDDGYRHMYAVSPWIETDPTSSVPFNKAPLLGENKIRLIKTHMPAQLIQQNDAAKYIYVTRHPVSCFASVIDFVHMLAGPLSPTRQNLLEWYCSEEMFWQRWPDHVEGWWRRSQDHDNVLFVHFEEMKKDLGAVVDRVATLLEVTLTAEERLKVVEKSGFSYMSENEEHFEMFSPNVFSVSEKEGRFMKSGALERFNDATEYEKKRINEMCQQCLAEASYPIDKFYPDVVEGINAKKAAPAT
ncbi:MAG: hypothetical protein COB51_06810 [Moraxellaceae bacterium]|nr:MAG: hypothetical protein COB51_06810 [Moraxellaceae bacterium]